MPLTNASLPAAEKATAPKAPVSSRCLLIVDDEEGPRQALRMVFRDIYHLLLAASGAEAVQLAQRNRVDVAIVDIRMEGMTGIDVLKHLKEIDPATEVIMLTAYGTLETARQALQLRAADYLAKPFDIPGMRAAVEAAMERRMVSDLVRSNHQRLQELRQELEDQRLREAIVRNRGEIYGSVLHDINGPLTTIACHVALMSEQLASLRWLDTQSTAEFKSRLETVNRYVNNCVEITQRYLGFLRQQGGEPEWVSLSQTLKDLGMLLAAHPAARDNELVMPSSDLELKVRMHGTDLLQVLLNLAENALQCTPLPHRVEISAALLPAAAHTSICFRDGPTDRFLRHDEFDPNQDLAALTVADNGPGMEPAVLRKLFQQQLTTKPAPLGTGFGLVIVKRLLMLGRCALTLQSAPGNGTRFTIYAPVR